MHDKVMAVDFDGTLFENNWPEIGAPKPKIIQYVKDQQQQGTKLVLWTCREGQMLIDAVHACRNEGLYFDGINVNLQERMDFFHTDPRKIGAEEYLDDRAVSVESIENPAPTWTAIEDDLPDEFKSDSSINWVLVYVEPLNHGNYPEEEKKFIARLYLGSWYDGPYGPGLSLENARYCQVTHWMPLPIGPKEDK